MAAEPTCAKEHTHTGDDRRRRSRRRRHAAERRRLPQGRFQPVHASTCRHRAATIDQKGCQYHPHVLALMTSQPLQVVNSDHDHAQHSPGPQEQPRVERVAAARSRSRSTRASRARKSPFPVKCNVHPWMKAYIAVVRQPVFPGHRQGRLLHASRTCRRAPTPSRPGTNLSAPSEQMVTVGPKESKAVTITFKAAAASD